MLYHVITVVDYTEVGPSGTFYLKSAHCNPNLIIKLAPQQIQIIENLKDVYENFGLKIQCFEDHIKILRLPSCLYKKVGIHAIT